MTAQAAKDIESPVTYPVAKMTSVVGVVLESSLVMLTRELDVNAGHFTSTEKELELSNPYPPP